MHKSLFRSILSDLWPILRRNIFSLVVIIIGGLSLTLIILGDKRDGFFLFIVILINIIIGIIQELRARIALEKLQNKIAQTYSVNRQGKNIKIYAEEIIPNDVIKLSLGDQVPVDGVLQNTNSLECNEALLSGESQNVAKGDTDKILAGSIIVAGSGELIVKKTASQSYLAKMTDQLKLYSNKLSPIQKNILDFIKLMSIVLVVIAIAVMGRSFLVGESLVLAISQIASVAATIIAEGLILTTTIFFVYGAVKLANKNILLQQVNAIENFGRIKTVCVDKTGTLTENEPAFEKIIAYNLKENKLKNYLSSYLSAESSHTSTSQALLGYAKGSKPSKASEYLAFSSERKYGAIRLRQEKTIVLVGAGENFFKYLNQKEKSWLQNNIREYSEQAMRVIGLFTASSGNLQDPKSLKKLHIGGVVVLKNPLKKGTTEIINFLQKRGINIIVVSGDNEKTVSAIATQAGITFGNKIYKSSQVENKTIAELVNVIDKKPLFARILPHQKKRIIEAAQQRGLVAMVGDGANDALAIKQADVGVAMFSGSAATRQVADAVLLNNSFGAFPSAIELSDSVITTLEMIACLFFSRVWTGVFLLFSTLLVNINYPFSPRNISLINLFIVGFPVLLWGAWPRSRTRSVTDESFLERTLPFSVFNGLLIAMATFVAFLSAHFIFSANILQQTMIAYVVFMITSIFTITLIPGAMGAKKNTAQTIAIWAGFILFFIIISAVFNVEESANFFGLQLLPFVELCFAAVIAVGTIFLQKISASFHLGNHLWYKLKTYRHKQLKKAHAQKA